MSESDPGSGVSAGGACAGRGGGGGVGGGGLGDLHKCRTKEPWGKMDKTRTL